MQTLTSLRAPVSYKKKVVKNTVSTLWFTILPPPHICSDVSVIRDDIRYLIGHGFEGQRSLPVISLFRYNGNYATDLVDIIERRARLAKPFNIFLKDFGYLQQDNNHTIYLDVVNRFAVTELIQQLTGEAPELNPCIPVAHKLPEIDFMKCWPYLKSLNYGNQHFPCIGLVVFIKEKGRWVKGKTIPFLQPY